MNEENGMITAAKLASYRRLHGDMDGWSRARASRETT